MCLLFLQLCSAHVTVDFVLRPLWSLDAGRRGPALLRLFLAHVALACLLVNVGLDFHLLRALLPLAASHALLAWSTTSSSDRRWLGFLTRQAGHLALVGILVLWAGSSGGHEATEEVARFLTSPRPYLLFASYVSTVFGGGLLVQRVTHSFLTRIEVDINSLKPGLPQAGTYIGWLERFLVLTFVIAGYNDGIGFLIAVKALARFPEIKEDSKGHFAEYFLVGTLTSVGVALIAGVIVSRAWSSL